MNGRPGVNVDVAVIGGGPGGLAVATLCAGFGLSCVVFDDKPTLGGQLREINHPVGDYLGLPVQSGVALAEAFAAHASSSGARLCVGEAVLRIDVRERTVETARWGARARFLVLAMGARPRVLGVPGEREWVPPGDRCGLPSGIVPGSRAVVIGGGDNAAEIALFAADRGASVTVLVRRDLRATRARRQALRRHPNVRVMLGAPVVGFCRTGVTLAGTAEVVPADRVFTRLGYTPNSELVAGQLACNDEGLVLTDNAGLTREAGVAAIGDLVNGPRRASIPSAVGQAMIATKALFCNGEREIDSPRVRSGRQTVRPGCRGCPSEDCADSRRPRARRASDHHSP
jgi:thioredoxin reductase (NADPH)